MSLLFADIYDGIRTIRITKGVTEKDILNFVQEKVGGCMSVANVLKTIRTLKKLVEDGVLMKKGKRYMFAPKKSRKDEEEEEEDEDENQEEMQPQVLDSCDECDDGAEDNESEDDDDDDDDDEEEDDDDDDDDDDEDSDCKDTQAEGDVGSGKSENTMEINKNPVPSKASILKGGGQNNKSPNGNGNNENGNGNNPNCLDKKVNRVMNGDNVKKDGNDKGKKMCKGKSMGDQDGEGISKGNEAIAFCVRDFIDSLTQPDCEGKEKIRKSNSKLEENMDLTKSLEFGREISLKKRCLRNKRNAGRSRSLLREDQADLYNCSHEIGFREICSDFFQDPADVEMEVDQKKAEEVTTIHSSNSGEKCADAEKTQSVLEEGSYEDIRETLAKKTSVILPVQKNECALGPMSWYPLEEREKEETEAENRSSSDEGSGKEKAVSLCSICEKKKRNV